VQHQLAVTGRDEARLVALVAESETFDILMSMNLLGIPTLAIVDVIKAHGLKEYIIRRDPELSETILQAESDWWQRHIVDGEPVPDFALAVDSGKVLQASTEQAEWIRLLKESIVTIKAAEAVRDEMTDKLKATIGEDSGIESEHGRITWKRSKDSEPKRVVEWEAMARGVLNDLPREEFDEIAKKFEIETVRHGCRRFVTPRNWTK
jgi:predicted phage-related endonuclease